MSVQTSLKPRGRTAPRAGRLWLCVLVGAMSPASMGRAQSASTPDVPAVVLNALRSRVIVSGLRPPSSTVLTIQHPESLITSLGDPYARLLSPPRSSNFAVHQVWRMAALEPASSRDRTRSGSRGSFLDLPLSDPASDRWTEWSQSTTTQRSDGRPVWPWRSCGAPSGLPSRFSSFAVGIKSPCR